MQVKVNDSDVDLKAVGRHQFDGKRKRQHKVSHGLPIGESIMTYVFKGKPKRDNMFNYQSLFLEIGLLVKHFYDVVSDGDGVAGSLCYST